MSKKETDRFLDNIRWCRIHLLHRQGDQALKEAKELIAQAKEFKAEAKRLEDRFDGILMKRKRKKHETRKDNPQAQASVHQDA